MPDKNRLQDLAHKWLNDTLSVEEQEEFDLWFAQVNDDPLEVPGNTAVNEQEHEHALFAKIKMGIEASGRSKTFSLWRFITAAAAVIVMCGIGVYFYNFHKSDTGGAEFARFDQKVVPGKNAAILTLANGKVIQLSDQKTGVVINASKLSYNDGSVVTPAIPGKVVKPLPMSDVVVQALTISTPRGGTYQVILPDGTKVWLNAASVLKFPPAFTGLAKRTVFLSGEAYFEVSKNKSQPFVVKSTKQQVEVLGTHFNVNAYSDESAVKTTLMEGSVRILYTLNHVENSVQLMPDQQAVLADGITVKHIEAENEIAWKNGDFSFDSDNLESIMRKIARWYDVEVTYAQKPNKSLHFGGIVSRNKNISKVLKIMQSTGQVSFKTEGRKILVIQN